VIDLSQFKTSDELLAEDLASSPEFRAEWERTALARAVSLAVLRYRTDHGLSQTALANKLGMRQPQVSRLELGEHNPSMETLMRLSACLGLEFNIQVKPVVRAPGSVNSVAAQARVHEPTGHSSEIVVTAAAA
jgi:ribosome-binding protein aMBF1 (putative translation factor)